MRTGNQSESPRGCQDRLSPCLACGLFSCRFGPDKKYDRSARCDAQNQIGMRASVRNPQKGTDGGGLGSCQSSRNFRDPTPWSGPCTLLSLGERVHPPLAHGIQLHPTPQPPRLGRSVPHVLCIRKHVAKLNLASVGS